MVSYEEKITEIFDTPALDSTTESLNLRHVLAIDYVSKKLSQTSAGIEQNSSYCQ
jgi:hypothetical protein